jgi:hypothetical protein
MGFGTESLRDSHRHFRSFKFIGGSILATVCRGKHACPPSTTGESSIDRYRNAV